MRRTPDGWIEAKLGDIAEEVTVGHVGSMASEYQESGVMFLRSQNIVPHGFDLSDVRHISAEFHARLRKSSLVAGDVVTVRTGKPGATAVIPDGWQAANCSDLVITRPGPNLDSRWLSYYINSVAGGFINNRLVGAVQQHFNVGAAREMDLCLPSMREQRAIAEVLGALDDKIAANRKLAATAGDLARAKFRQMGDETLNMPLSATAQFVNGRAFTKGASGTGRVVIRITELNSGIGSSTVFSDVDVDEQYVARPGDMLFAWSGSLTLHRWFREEAIINQHIFKVIPNDGYPDWLVYQLIEQKLPFYKDVAADKATTMGHIQRKHLDELVPVPSPMRISENAELMSSLWDRTLLAEQESERLKVVRDALLPRLMSGELRVRDALRVVEDVL